MVQYYTRVLRFALQFTGVKIIYGGCRLCGSALGGIVAVDTRAAPSTR